MLRQDIIFYREYVGISTKKLLIYGRCLNLAEEMAMFSFFGILFLIETKISDGNNRVIISLLGTRGNGNVLMT